MYGQWGLSSEFQAGGGLEGEKRLAGIRRFRQEADAARPGEVMLRYVHINIVWIFTFD